MNLNRVDLNLLVVFAAIAQTRSVTLAAEKLSLSQPAVSHALNRLRQMMDDPLFIRGKDGFTLTARAESLVTPIFDLLANAENLLEPPKFDPATTDKTFHICVSDYSMATVIPHLVRRFRKEAPLARIELYSASETFVDRLEKGEFDLAFWPSNITPKSLPLQSQELFRERFIGILHQSHPLAEAAKDGSLSLDDYLAYPHIQMSFRNHEMTSIEKALLNMQRTRKLFMVAQGFTNNLASLVDTDLIMAIPSRLEGDFIEAFHLISFELPFEHEAHPYSIIWHTRSDRDPAMIWLRQLITNISHEYPQILPKKYLNKKTCHFMETVNLHTHDKSNL